MISIVASSITVYHSSTHTLATPLRVLRVAPLHVNVGSAFHDPTASIRPIHAIFIMLLDGGGGACIKEPKLDVDDAGDSAINLIVFLMACATEELWRSIRFHNGKPQRVPLT